MDTAIRNAIVALVGLVALSGVATAQGCPECDEDGPADPDNSYHDTDAGLVLNETDRVLADTDVALDDKTADGGFFAWLSLCFNAFIQKVEDAVGLGTGVDANAEAYVSEDGVDVDVTARALGQVVDFDDSPIGHADGETWKVMGEVSADVRDLRSDLPEAPDAPDTFVDVCANADLSLVTCG